MGAGACKIIGNWFRVTLAGDPGETHPLKGRCWGTALVTQSWITHWADTISEKSLPSAHQLWLKFFPYLKARQLIHRSDCRRSRGRIGHDAIDGMPAVQAR